MVAVTPIVSRPTSPLRDPLFGRQVVSVTPPTDSYELFVGTRVVLALALVPVPVLMLLIASTPLERFFLVPPPPICAMILMDEIRPRSCRRKARCGGRVRCWHPMRINMLPVCDVCRRRRALRHFTHTPSLRQGRPTHSMPVLVLGTMTDFDIRFSAD